MNNRGKLHLRLKQYRTSTISQENTKSNRLRALGTVHSGKHLKNKSRKLYLYNLLQNTNTLMKIISPSANTRKQVGTYFRALLLMYIPSHPVSQRGRQRAPFLLILTYSSSSTSIQQSIYFILLLYSPFILFLFMHVFNIDNFISNISGHGTR